MESMKSLGVIVALISCMVLGACNSPQQESVPELPASVGINENMQSDSSNDVGSVSTNKPAYTPDPVTPSKIGSVYAVVGEETLIVELADNSSAQAFVDLLAEGPLTVEMSDYGGFEKVGPLGTYLPTNDKSITAEPGDVILYQGDKITIYYGTNSWNFTRMGKVQGVNQDDLKRILGEGTTIVTFRL